MKILITGGCGFLGSNLAGLVMAKGKDKLFILDNLYREGSQNNLQWLKSKGNFKFYNFDIRIKNNVEKVVRDIKPDIIFHLA
jgi:CDP-paratose 2-epimerase